MRHSSSCAPSHCRRLRCSAANSTHSRHDTVQTRAPPPLRTRDADGLADGGQPLQPDHLCSTGSSMQDLVQ